MACIISWPMKMSTEIRTGRHCVFNLHVHLVFVTKYRRDVFEKAHYATMRTIFEKVCTDFEANLVEIDGEADHVHLLVAFPAEGFGLVACKQPERCFQQAIEERTPGTFETVLERDVMDAELFCSKLRWCPDRNHQTVHRTTTHTRIAATRPALYPRPERRGFTAGWIIVGMRLRYVPE